MDLQALDAAFIQTSARPQRDESPSDSGRMFTAELNQAMTQRRQEAEPRPERPRVEERTAERPDRPIRKADSAEPRARREADAGRSNRDQDRVAGATEDQASAPAETAASEPSNEEKAVDVAVSDQSGSNQPEIAAAPAEPTEPAAKDDAAPTAIAVPVPLVIVDLPAPTAVAPVVEAEVAPVVAPAVIPAEVDPAAALAEKSAATPPVATVPTGAPTSPAAYAEKTTPAAIVVAPAATAPTDTGSSPNVVALQATAPGIAPSPNATATAAATADVAAVSDASVAAQAVAAATGPTTPNVDPAIVVTVATAADAAPPKPAASSLLTLQSMDDAALPAAPVENGPTPTATVTTAAVQPATQGASVATQTQAPDQPLITASAPAPAAQAPVPSFADAIGEAAAVDASTEAASTEQTQSQAGNPVHASAERRAGVEQTVRAESAQPARQNLPPQPVADQIAVRIAKQTQAGDGKITMQLRPEALGRVDVDLEVRKDGSMRAVISVEKPETLEWLKRDAQHLERALQDAGMKTDSGSLNFALREQRQEGSGGFSRSGRQSPGFDGEAQPGEGRVAEARMAEAAARRNARGGVDVRI